MLKPENGFLFSKLIRLCCFVLNLICKMVSSDKCQPKWYRILALHNLPLLE